MKSEIKTWLIIINLLCVICGLFLGLASVGFVVVLTIDFSAIGFLGLICIGSVAICILSIGLTLFKSVTIDESKGSIGIIYFGLYSRYWTINDIKGYKTYSLMTRFGILEQTLVISNDGKQISISEGALKNYHEMRDRIQMLFKENNHLIRNEWLVINKMVFLFGAVWLLAAITTKLLS